MSNHLTYRDRSWERQPAAEASLRGLIDAVLAHCPEAREYADRLHVTCGVRLRDLIDHISLGHAATLSYFQAQGWIAAEDGAWSNPSGYFPDLIEGERDDILYLRVDRVETFLKATGADAAIEGCEHSPFRRAIVFRGAGTGLGVVERNGFMGYEPPRIGRDEVRAARLHAQALRSRRRQFDTVEEGLAHTEALVDAAVAAIGPHWACDLWLRAEREFWMQRCRPGLLQKMRQDAVGVGWANIDHHTYDSSRRHYRHTIRILEKLGYELREMLYAGDLAGWGSQILEQPVLRSTIFADVDLAPSELDIDFAHEPLPELPKHRRAGVLSVMHGESILEAGLNHVAGLYDQRALRAQLEAVGVHMMQPFSSMAHLYQELTQGDRVAVDPSRVDLLEREGHLSSEEAEEVRMNGAILSHLENIERNDGYKGFNKPGIDGVLRKLDPRAYETAAAAATA